MFNPYKQFKLLYPKSIQIETVIFIFHIFRKQFLTKVVIWETRAFQEVLSLC